VQEVDLLIEIGRAIRLMALTNTRWFFARVEETPLDPDSVTGTVFYGCALDLEAGK